MGEASLFVMIERKLFGISLKELKNLGKEPVAWREPLSPAPLFGIDLPDMRGINLFVFYSKIHVLGGGLSRPSEFDEKGAVPPLTFYQFDVDKKEFTMTDLISPPPTVFIPSFMGNISNAVYLVVFRGPRRLTKDGFWVLSPSGQWKRLSSPAPMEDYGDLVLSSGGCYVLQDKLLFHVRTLEEQHYLHLFDPAFETWKEIEYGHHNCWINSLYFPGVMLSLPGLHSSSSVALSWAFQHTDKRKGYVLIKASLVSNQNLAVRVRQSLWECLEGTQPPSYFDISSIRAALVDLGDDMVCALVYGHTDDHHGGDSPVLCMSVFTLAVLVEPDIDMEIDTEPSQKEQEPDTDKEIDTEVVTQKQKIDPEASQKEQEPDTDTDTDMDDTDTDTQTDTDAETHTEGSQEKQEHKFLSVHVVVKRVFAMEDLDIGCAYPPVLRPFMFRPKMELPH